MMKLEKSWYQVLKEEIEKPYIQELKQFLESEQKKATVYPPEPLVFNAFSQTPFEKVKVVIVGQDPYHGPGQAHGLSFSVPCGIEPPPSLKNIFKELQTDVGFTPTKTGCLTPWAKQGVLLLNATLTVQANTPRSHYGKGWEDFTDAVVKTLYARREPLVFVLWGRSAKEKIDRLHLAPNSHHLILTAAHPSPLSAYNGFFGCGHFSKINEFLKKEPINWQL